jgi:hypothetical protein
MRQRIGSMRRQLMESLTGQFDREVMHSVDRVRDATAPYPRFVRGEHERLIAAESQMTTLQSRLQGLQRRLGAPVS